MAGKHAPDVREPPSRATANAVEQPGREIVGEPSRLCRRETVPLGLFRETVLLGFVDKLRLALLREP